MRMCVKGPDILRLSGLRTATCDDSDRKDVKTLPMSNGEDALTVLGIIVNSTYGTFE